MSEIKTFKEFNEETASGDIATFTPMLGAMYKRPGIGDGKLSQLEDLLALYNVSYSVDGNTVKFGLHLVKLDKGKYVVFVNGKKVATFPSLKGIEVILDTNYINEALSEEQYKILYNGFMSVINKVDENLSVVDFAKTVAKVMYEDYGNHVLQMFFNEFKTEYTKLEKE